MKEEDWISVAKNGMPKQPGWYFCRYVSLDKTTRDVEFYKVYFFENDDVYFMGDIITVKNKLTHYMPFVHPRDTTSCTRGGR